MKLTARLGFLLFLFWMVPACAEELRFAVLAFRDAEKVAQRWQPLAEHLAHRLPGKRFRILALTYAELEKAIQHREIDIVLTQPAHYILLKHREQLSAPALTLITLENGVSLKAFGGVIVVRADRSELKGLDDLKGRKIAVTNRQSFGGNLMQLYELHRKGVEIGRLTFIEVGMPHDRVIEAVLRGEADAGFIRTGVLEAMIAEGKVGSNALRVLNAQHLPNFPLQLSTRLYPEWPLVILPHVRDETARGVVSALLDLLPGGALARALGIHGFDLPADYAVVEETLRALRAPPFDAPQTPRWRDIWHGYSHVIVTGMLLAAALFAALFILLVQQRRLSQERARLAAAVDEKREETEKLLAVLAGAGAAIWRYDRQNGSFRLEHSERLGFSLPSEATASWEAFQELLHPDDRASCKFVGECCDCRCDLRVRDAEGQWHWVLMRTGNNEGAIHYGSLVNVDERKGLETRLRTEMEQLREILDALGEGVFGVDAKGRITFINAAMVSLLGYTREQLMGAHAHTLFHGRRRDGSPYPQGDCPVFQTLQDRQPRLTQEWFWRQNGQPLPVLQSVAALQQGGAVVAFIDMSTEWSLRERERVLSRAVEAAPGGILVTDRSGRLVWANEAFLKLSGYSLAEAIGRTPGQLVKSGHHPREFYEAFWRTLLAKQIWQGEIINRRRDGSLYHEWMVAAPVLDDQGEIQNFVALKQDITERKRLEEELRRQASIDALTGLANRREFYRAAERELARVRRGGNATLLLADFDHFKAINDLYGHAAGDAALVAFARLLLDGLRQMDLAARWGGEEFIVLLPDTSAEDAAKLAERLRQRLAAMTIHEGDAEFRITASFGVAIIDAADERIEHAIARADEALYRAKQGGRNRVIVHPATMVPPASA
ncbi:MAG: diguanylate cyclase [Rhodocyclaceae bacterium]|nr:diguanylate cyclase [Rhodocyclaceae bacterium]